MPNRICLFLVCLVAAGSASAADGMIQINHQRALAGGVTAGDTPGYPVTLSQSGNYILTSDLTAPDQNTNIIEITTDRVSIDMNRFSIAGTSLCLTPPTTTCTNPGTGSGISSSEGLISIENGLIMGMGNRGISLLGLGYRLRDVAVTNCAGDGIVLGPRGTIFDSQVGFNGGTGINMGDGAHLYNTSSGFNGVNGFSGTVAPLISGGGFGGNLGSGISSGNSAIIENVNVNANSVHGITVGTGSLIKGCLSSGNGGFGLVFPAANGVTASGYKDCVINSNATGTVSGGEGVQVGTNLCGANTTCP